MQPKLLILLAVLSDMATAGLVRRNGPFVRSNRHVRSFNQSSISVAPLQPQIPTTSSKLSTSILPLKAVSDTTTSSETISKQVGSVPAFGDGPGAATIDPSTLTTQTRQSFSVAASTSSHTSTSAAVPLPSNKPYLSSTSQDQSTSVATSKQVGSVPAFGDGPGAATISSPIVSTTKGPLSTPIPAVSTTSPPALASSATGAVRASKEADSSTFSTMISFSRSFTLGTGIGSQNPTTSQAPTPSAVTTFQSTISQSLPLSTSSAPALATTSPKSVSTQNSNGLSTQTASTNPTTVSVSLALSVPSSTSKPTSIDSATTSSQSSPPALTNTPDAQNGNIAMALGFNAIFETMTPQSSCDASNNKQASACINEQPAQCDSNGKYVMSACPQGQRCFALPLSAGITGIIVQCATPSDANAKLGLGASSGSNSSTTGPAHATSSQAPTSSASSGALGTSSAPGTKQSSQEIPIGPAQVPSTSPGALTSAPTASSLTTKASPSAPPTVSPKSTESASPSLTQVPSTTSSHTPVVISFPSDTSSSPGRPTPSPETPVSSTNSTRSTTPAAALPEPASTSAPTATSSSTTSVSPGGIGPVTVTETVTVTTTAR